MDSNKADTFFTVDEQLRISSAVHAAEQNTSGEIATMVVTASDSYREAGMLGSFFFAGLLALVMSVLSHHVTIWTYIPLLLLLYFPCYLLLARAPRLKLMFIGRGRLVEAVSERAIRAFYEKGLHRTKDETGILIFISLLEHKVWILGDRGINARIPTESWRAFAGQLAAGLRSGRACEALCVTIGDCGAELARHFPRQAGDTNELTDEILH
jgi:putative membrane protein